MPILCSSAKYRIDPYKNLITITCCSDIFKNPIIFYQIIDFNDIEDSY